MTPKAALGADARRKEESTEQPGREIWSPWLHVLWPP